MFSARFWGPSMVASQNIIILTPIIIIIIIIAVVVVFFYSFSFEPTLSSLLKKLHVKH